MNFIKTVAVVVLIAVAVFFGLRLLSPEDSWICKDGSWQQHGKPSSPMPSTPCEKEPRSASKDTSLTTQDSNKSEYNNSEMGFKVMLPLDIKTSKNLDGTISLSMWGPTQKTATELFDGFSININQGSLGANKDLKSLIEADIVQKKEQLAPDFKITKNIVETKGGYSFQTQEQFGLVDYVYLSQSGDKFLLISIIQRDPGNQGFDKIISNIISGITMTN